MVSIIIFIAVLGIMILVHEFGHFMVAKLFKVKVLVFSLGMGPTIFARQKGETKYRLAAFPLGGYVKMLGETPGDTEDKIDPDELHRSYWEQTPLKRMAITAAGPFLNLVLAFLLAPISFMIGIEMPSYPMDPPVVLGIAPDSPADKAEFRYGDRLVEIDGKKFDTWQRAEEYFYINPDTEINIKFERDGKILDASITPRAHEKYAVGISGFDVYETTVIGGFSKKSPAKEAGLVVGDRIISIAGKPIKAFSSMRDIIQKAAPGPFKVGIIKPDKPDKIVEVELTPVLMSDARGESYKIGVGPYVPYTTVRYGPIKAFGAGSAFLWDKAISNIEALGKLFTGRLGLKAMSGPVGIGFVIGSARRAGFSHLVQITALISLLLGIINFFPIPALDGGHILFASMELISRRKLNRKVLDILNTAGFAMLMMLILVVTIQDIYRFREEIFRFFGIG